MAVDNLCFQQCNPKYLILILISVVISTTFMTAIKLQNISFNTYHCEYVLPNVSPTASKSKSVRNPFPVVVRPIGGLGNQLFQYSAAYSVARNRNSDLYICLTSDDYNATLSPDRKNVTSHRFNAEDRSYALDFFKIPQDKLLIIPPGKFECPVQGKSEFGYVADNEITIYNEADILSNVVANDQAVLQKGYMASEIFFKQYKNELMDLFTLDVNIASDPVLTLLLQIIENTESVSVHLRRGDYIKNPLFPSDVRNMTNEYYTQAMNLIIKKIKENRKRRLGRKIAFFIFSDEIESVKADFAVLFKNWPYEMFYCSNENSSRIIDFYLMMKCKHNIISSGSYGYWPAYLNRNPDKTVIAPWPKYPSGWTPSLEAEPDKTQGLVLTKVYQGEWSYPSNWITVNPLFPKK